MTNNYLGHHTTEAAKSPEAVAKRKDPIVAFAVGILFGALGVAIYLRNVKDFFCCLGAFFLASAVLEGLGSALSWPYLSLLSWFVAPAYGAWRAHASNTIREI